ncbi:MAG: hypothetical protein SF070_18140 [Gemmatimonadota bacterium]|nr:hypothetical protein [Gemmatimonadota bacterium]
MGNRIPSPFDSPALWESLKLVGPRGTVTVPNVTVNVRGGGLKEDSRPVPGQDGREVTFLGFGDAEIEVESVADTEAEFRKVQAGVELYGNRRDGGRPAVVTAIHPNIQLHGITGVYIFRVETPDYSPQTGFVTRFSLRQWQSKTTGTAGASKVQGGAGAGGSGANDGRQGNAPANPNAPRAQQTAANPPSKTAAGAIGAAYARGVAAGSAFVGGN